MSSDRAQAARRLASRLTKDTGVSVAVIYQRRARHYRVRWQSGPDTNSMQYLAANVADEVQPLVLHDLTWERT